MPQFVINYVFPIAVILVFVVISFIYTKNVKDKTEKTMLKILKAVDKGSDVAGMFIHNDTYNQIREIIDMIVYSVEELSKTKKMESEEKHQLAKDFYYKICKETGLESYAKISEEAVDLIIKSAVFIMNKTYNNK